MTARITSATRVSLKFIRGGLGLGSRSSQRSRCRLVSGSLPSVLLTRPVWRATCRTAQAITSLGPSIFSRPMGACESRQGCSKACIDRGAGSQTSTDLLPISSPLQAPVSSQGESLACHQHVAHHVEGRLLAQHADAARLNGASPPPTLIRSPPLATTTSCASSNSSGRSRAWYPTGQMMASRPPHVASHTQSTTHAGTPPEQPAIDGGRLVSARYRIPTCPNDP